MPKFVLHDSDERQPELAKPVCWCSLIEWHGMSTIFVTCMVSSELTCFREVHESINA